MVDGEVVTGETGPGGAGLMVSTGILGDLVLPAGAEHDQPAYHHR
jgi:hypothetical protein